MIRHPDPEAHERAVAALKSEDPLSAVSWEISVAGTPLPCDSFSCAPEGGAAVILEAAPSDASEAPGAGGATSFPRKASAALTLTVDGVAYRRYEGEARPKAGDAALGEPWRLMAVTPGWWRPRVPVGRPLSYRRADADLAAFEILSLLPYDGDKIEVLLPPAGPLTRENERMFDRLEKTEAVLAAIAGETGARFPDTHDGGAKGYVPKPAALGGEVAWEFEIGRDLEEGAFSSSPAVDEFSRVVAFRRVEPSAEFPDGVQVLAEAAVPGSSAPDAPYEIEISDSSTDAFADADARVVEAATNLEQGEGPVTAVLPFLHGLLVEGDVVAFSHTAEEGDHFVRRRWLVRLDELPRLEGDPQRTTLKGTGVLRETRTEKPADPPPEGSGGVLRPLYGLDHLGRLYVPAEWAEYDPARGLVLDAEEAARSGVSISYERGRGLVLTDG